MTKQEMAKSIAERAGLDSAAQASKAMDATLEIITDELASGGSIQLRGFGTFSTSDRKARTGRNPRTGEPIQIPARRVVAFSAGNDLKKAANSPHFGLDWLKFKDLSNKVEDLKSRIESKVRNPEKLGKDARRYLDNAQALYEDAGSKIKEAADSGGKAWGEVRTGLENAYSELKTAWKKAKDSF